MPDESTSISDQYSSRTVEIPFPLVPDECAKMLSEKQEFDYRNKREDFARWLLLEGKDPTDKEGYTEATAKRTMYRVGIFQRWVWQQKDEYVSDPDADLADEFIEVLAYADKSQSHKHHTLHSMKRYYKWREHEHGEDEWDPDRTFTVSNSQNPQDHLTVSERKTIRQAALEYGTFPTYSTVKTDEERRERMRPYVADYLGKPPDAVSVADWEEAKVPSWRYTSLVWASLDAGLRPDEVANATTEWVDTENAVLRIPKEESSKNTENWEVSIKNETADALENWLYERSHYPKYDDTNRLWLTDKNNPFSSKSLGRLIRRLCDRAGIPYENRQMSWYSIRHSVGTYMTREEDLAATQQQLRHQRPETTMKYDAAPPEDRRDALDKMG